LSAGERHLTFRHELARLAIEEATSPNRRMALHRAALAALTAHWHGAPDVAALAHHAEAAGDADAVLRWAPLAAERAAESGVHREAAAQYARALEFVDQVPLGERAELLRRSAEECWLTAQFGAAIVAQEKALECHRRLADVRGEGDSLRLLSRLLFFAGRTDEGEPLALEALRLLEQLPPGRELAIAYGNVSQRQMAIEDNASALVWGARALELAERLGDSEAVVYALTNIGAAELQGGGDEGRAKLERALALAKEHGLDEYVGRAFSSLVLWPVRLRRFELVGDYLEAGLSYCAEHGLDTWRLYCSHVVLASSSIAVAGTRRRTLLRSSCATRAPRPWHEAGRSSRSASSGRAAAIRRLPRSSKKHALLCSRLASLRASGRSRQRG
jgi:tetratricopeptide (TPR) repeat protein